MIPNFDRDHLEGQMSVVERKALYASVLQVKPLVVIEVGTWKGGGSTYIISSALHELKSGMLFSIETNPEFHTHAVNLYNGSLQELRDYVSLIFGSSHLFLYPAIASGMKVDYAILDGDISAEQTYKEFLILEDAFRSGSRIFCHDWNTSKMDIMKELLKDSPEWTCELMMDKEPTGSCIWRKI